MGLVTAYKRWKDKRQQKKAYSTGESLSSSGVKAVSTTSGTKYVDTGRGTGGVDTSSGGSGGGGSSGGSSGGGGSSRNVIPSGNIQQSLRDSGVNTQEQAKLTKSPVITQQNLRDRNIRERYNPRSNQFERSRDFAGGQGTSELVSARVPTREEQARIEIKNENIITTDLNKLKEKREKLERSERKLNELSKGKIDEEGFFTGSEKEYKEYEKAFREYQSIDKDIKVGVGKLSRQESIKAFDFERRPVTTSFNVLTGTISNVAGKAQEQYLKATGGKRNYQVLTGTKGILSPEAEGQRVSKVTKAGLDFGKYLIPGVGTGLFVAEGGELALDVTKTKKETGQITKQQKKEVAFFAGAVLTGGAIKGVSAYKNVRMFGRPSKLTSEVEITSLRKLKVENVEKPLLELAEGTRKVSKTKAGTTLSYEPAGELIKTTTKGTRFKETQIQDAAGNIIGVIEKPSVLGKFGKTFKTEYKISSSGEGTYQVFSGKKLLREGTTTQGAKKLGVLEPEVKEFKRPTKDVTNLEKERFIQEESGEILTQRIVSLDPKVTVKDSSIVRDITTKRNIKLEPSKTSEVLSIKSELGNKILKKETSRTRAELSGKGTAPDIINKGEGIIYPSFTIQKGIVIQSPTFEQVSKTTSTGRGTINLVRETPQTKLERVFIEPVTQPSGRLFSLVSPLTVQTKVKTPSVNFKPSEIKTEFFSIPGFKTTSPSTRLVNLGGTKTRVQKTEISLQTIKEEPAVTMNSIQEEQLISKVRKVMGDGGRKKSKTRTQEILKTVQKTTQKPKQISQPKIGLLQRLAQRPKLETLKIKTSIKTTQPKAKFTPKINLPKQSFDVSTPKKESNGFEAIAFKFGKKVKVGSGTKEEAAQILKGFLKGGLSASGFLVEKGTGKKVKASELLGIFGGEFREGKMSKSLIVERKSKRLRKSSTGSQIQFFR